MPDPRHFRTTVLTIACALCAILALPSASARALAFGPSGLDDTAAVDVSRGTEFAGTEFALGTVAMRKPWPAEPAEPVADEGRLADLALALVASMSGARSTGLDFPEGAPRAADGTDATDEYTIGDVAPDDSAGGPASGEPVTASADAAALPASFTATPAPAVVGDPLAVYGQVLAFYGKPGSARMGILGEYPKEKLAPLLEGYVALYDAANGDRGVVPALYIIYGTCWPEGEIGYLSEAVTLDYIRFASERGWLVFLDHQIGKYDVDRALSTMLPYLRFPNVHLALDPEWRTLRPMKEIGSVTAAELNAAQLTMTAYLADNGLPGRRMLVVHQFKPVMIRDRENLSPGTERVVLVHTADGFGSPELKRMTYRSNAAAVHLPVKGFKLFLESKVVGAGWDKPLMLPEDVMALDPVPVLVIYQ